MQLYASGEEWPCAARTTLVINYVTGFMKIPIVAMYAPELSGCTLTREFANTAIVTFPFQPQLASAHRWGIFLPSVVITVWCLIDLLMSVILLSRSPIWESYSSLNNRSFLNTFLHYCFWLTYFELNLVLTYLFTFSPFMTTEAILPCKLQQRKWSKH